MRGKKGKEGAEDNIVRRRESAVENSNYWAPSGIHPKEQNIFGRKKKKRNI